MAQKTPDRSVGANLEKMREQALQARKKCIGLDEAKADRLKKLIADMDEMIAGEGGR
jgi:hypothetical protein